MLCGGDVLVCSRWLAVAINMDILGRPKESPRMAPMRAGFTIIELSLVLTVIALIVAAVFLGGYIVRVSQLRAVVSEVEEIKTAINTFVTKYNCLPGDCQNAQSYLGAGVTNGNGNGQIDYNGGALGEEYQAWNHLSADGLLDGYYTGVATTSIPKSRLTGGLYRVSYQTSIYGKNANMISINSINLGSHYANLPVMSPVEANSIDVKMDDGLASTGSVFGFNAQGIPGCATNFENAASATYILTNKTNLCKMYFLLDY